jgi:hypothetical protein
MNKMLLSLLFLITINAISAGTVTVSNITTSSIDLYEQEQNGNAKIVLEKLKPLTTQSITISANNTVIIQSSATHHWKSPVFIRPSHEQNQRFFELSSCHRNGFVLKQLSHDSSL